MHKAVLSRGVFLAGLLLLAWCGVGRCAETAESGTAPEIPPVSTPKAQPDTKAEAKPAETVRQANQAVDNFLKQKPDFSSHKSGGGQAPVPAVSPWSVWGKLIVLLGVVGSVLWAGLLLVKKHLPGGKQFFSSPALEVLGRTHLDPRRYVALLRVGRRLLVLGVSPDAIEGLSEITDEAEVTELLEVARPKTPAGGSVFQRLFSRHVLAVEAEAEKAKAAGAAERLGGSINDLREKVKNLREME